MCGLDTLAIALPAAHSVNLSLLPSVGSGPECCVGMENKVCNWDSRLDNSFSLHL